MEIAAMAGAPDAAAIVDKTLAGGAHGRPWYSPYPPRALRAYLYQKAGDPTSAKPLLDKAWEVEQAAMSGGDRSYTPLYASAGIGALRGDRDAAIDLLDRATRIGWKDSKFLGVDPLLASIQSDPRFVATRRRIEREIAEMHARTDWSGVDALIR